MTQNPAVWLAIYYVMWVCIPMIPSTLIYWLFPKEQIGVTGPLAGLTINASGAFAAYVITFALAFPIVQHGQRMLGAMAHPMWTISAKVKLVDEATGDVNPDWLKGLVVELRPDFYNAAEEFVNVKVPEINGDLPNVVLRIPNFGSRVIDLSGSGVERDDYEKEIIVKEPIIIKKSKAIIGGVANAAVQ